VQTKDRRRIITAIFSVFFLEAVVLGNWIPRIPDIKANLTLSDAMLGLCLLAIPLGTVVGLLVAGRIMERTGYRKACQIFLPLWAILFVLPAFADSAMLLAMALLACGFAVGIIEVAMNTEADRIEAAMDTRLMSRCHGFWSLGSMVGALLGGAIAQFGFSVQAHFVIVMPVIAVVGYYMSSLLPKSGLPETKSGDDKLFRLPHPSVMLLCLMPIGVMVVEGAFIDWSAVFMRSILDAPPIVISVTYAFFSVVMAVVRLSGDSLAERYGDYRLLLVSGFAATLGIATFAMAPNVVIAFFGAALSGMGVAIVYPLAVSAVARRPGRSAADNVAAISMIAFTAFLIAPPLIGFLSELFGLRWALLLLAPIAFCTVFLAKEVLPQTANSSAKET